MMPLRMLQGRASHACCCLLYHTTSVIVRALIFEIPSRSISNLTNDVTVLEEAYDRYQELDVKINIHQWSEELLALDISWCKISVWGSGLIHRCWAQGCGRMRKVTSGTLHSCGSLKSGH